MSIVFRHRFLVRELFAVPFHTRHGIAYHYISRNSVLCVHISGLKRSRKAPFKPSNPLQTKPNPVQALSTINTELPMNQEQELLDGSITVGAAAPSQTKPDDLVHEKPFQAPSTIKTVRSQKPEKERFASSVTMGAAPSPRHVPVPVFCLR